VYWSIIIIYTIIEGYGAYCSNHVLEGFYENEEIKEIEKSEENIKKKKVYTSDGINASDLITRVFLTLVKNI
jgi:hypothetical protein